MWRIIGNQRARAAEWAKPIFGVGSFLEEDKFTCLILERSLEIQAVSFYNQYSPRNSIQIHIAAVPGKRWMTRPFLRAAFRYPFLDLQVRRLGALVPADNLESLRLTRHLGFVEEGRAREAWAENVDIVCHGMLKSECRWLDGPPPDIWHIGPPDEFEAVNSQSSRSNGYDSGSVRS